jgi:hypothetical protein
MSQYLFQREMGGKQPLRTEKDFMKLIDYDKYEGKWSPRGTVLAAVVEAIVTGFFLGAALIVATHGATFRTWAWPLAMGFSTGIAALQTTLIALHNCPPSTKAR